MRITIIGYDDIFVDRLYSELKKLNHQVNRIDLYISNLTNDMSRESNEIRILELRNFHDLTIEIVEFEPDIIVYIPMDPTIKSEDELNEIDDIIHVELIEHILETARVVNSKICYFDLNNKRNNLTQLSVVLVSEYSQTAIIMTKLTEIDYPTIMRKILFK
ncbi:MAG: hypothetical protein GPJ54_03900 [Candidatus Heimdallarchaeota archaeon]|nr:hypothetical protein [Candidatus Heimdallarchaeota archaeon]